jgi:hypothetical protein
VDEEERLAAAVIEAGNHDGPALPGAELIEAHVVLLEYRRRLDPAWYFAPLERYGARLAASHLIDALAAPHVARLPERGERAMTRVADVFCRPFSTEVR